MYATVLVSCRWKRATVRKDKQRLVPRQWKQSSSVNISPLSLGEDTKWETLWGFLKELKDINGKPADALLQRKEQPIGSIRSRLRFDVLTAFEGRACAIPPPATTCPALGACSEPWWPKRLPFTKQKVLERHDLELKWSHNTDARKKVGDTRVRDPDAPEKAFYSCATWKGCKWRQHDPKSSTSTSLPALAISERIDEVLAGLWLELEGCTKLVQGHKVADVASIKLRRSPRGGQTTNNYKKALLEQAQAFLTNYPEAA